MINLDTPYECKRTKNLIKVKKFYTYDLQIIDVEEGSGKNKGMLGAFVGMAHRRRGKSCVNSIKTNLLGENYGRNNFYQGGFST